MIEIAKYCPSQKNWNQRLHRVPQKQNKIRINSIDSNTQPYKLINSIISSCYLSTLEFRTVHYYTSKKNLHSYLWWLHGPFFQLSVFFEFWILYCSRYRVQPSKPSICHPSYWTRSGSHAFGNGPFSQPHWIKSSTLCFSEKWVSFIP